jgi:hypothetical protein
MNPPLMPAQEMLDLLHAPAAGAPVFHNHQNDLEVERLKQKQMFEILKER